ncbi:hypothetical protein F5884DRAFT_773875 [Xylogone sp. PMI_703]|nr:hypothetical protein F5884DRAFT_773875 [Xylogone sp. PMI_703]
MSQPPAIPVRTRSPAMADTHTTPATFTLTIVSPSAGVNGPITFHDLPTATTVGELKARIREDLPTKPSDEGQRLIHRGRMLGRETETMLDIFGKEAILAGPQTLHLVLRPTTTDTSSSQAPVSNPIPAPGPAIGAQHAQHHHHHHVHHGNHLNHQLRQMTNQIPNSTPSTLPTLNPNLPAEIRTLQALQEQQLRGLQMQQMQRAEHMLTAQRMQQLQRETNRIYQDLLVLEQRHPQIFGNNGLNNHAQNDQATAPEHTNPPTAQHLSSRTPLSFQTLVAQQQRDRAAAGQNGLNLNGTVTPPIQAGLNRSGRASPVVHPPEYSRTYVREGIGAHGERWQVTVNETTTTVPIPRPNSTPGFRNEANNHAIGVQPNLHSPHISFPGNNGFNHQNVLNQIPAQHNNTFASGFLPMQPPQILHPPVTYNATLSGVPSAALASSNDGPVVYILSSPSGPRALLVSNTDTFYMSQQPTGAMSNPTVHASQDSPQSNGVVAGENGGDINRAHLLQQPHRRHRHRQENAQDAPNIVPIGGHPGNPGAGALAIQLLPHLWLIIRLIGFVWFFTSGHNSWARLLTITGLAVVVFIVNTGILNGVAEQLWGPVRRHLEGLLPLAGPAAAAIPAANAAIAPQQREQQQPQGRRGARAEPDPAQVAARLLEQHRLANGGWLMAQIRRAEHAMLLFLASLVPGVGERHIAAREAEAAAAEAERNRREQEQAEREAAENNTGEAGPNDNAEAVHGEPNVEAAPEPAVQPLIDI